MFSTFNKNKINLPDVFGQDVNETLWNSVEINLFTPYFLVQLGPSATIDEDRTHLVLLTAITQLLANSADKSVALSNAMLLSPGYLNGSSDWRLERLESVDRGVERGTGDHCQYAHIFKVTSGARYLHAALANSEQELTDIVPILDFS